MVSGYCAAYLSQTGHFHVAIRMCLLKSLVISVSLDPVLRTELNHVTVPREEKSFFSAVSQNPVTATCLLIFHSTDIENICKASSRLSRLGAQKYTDSLSLSLCLSLSLSLSHTHTHTHTHSSIFQQHKHVRASVHSCLDLSIYLSIYLSI